MRAVRKAIAEVGRMPIDGGNTVADLVSALSEGLGGGVKITYKELVDPLALVCQSRDEWLKLGMTAKYHFATLSSRLGLNLTKSSVRGFQNLWKGALRDGVTGDYTNKLYYVFGYSVAFNKQGMVRFLEMFDNLGSSTYKFTMDSADPKKWTSPGGLVYGADNTYGNRTIHVLNHSLENPVKIAAGKPHGVFTLATEEIFQLFDYVKTNFSNLTKSVVPNQNHSRPIAQGQ